MSAPSSGGNLCLIHIPALGWGLSAALVVIFVLCFLATVLLSELPLAHSWIELFTIAPMGSLRNFVEGVAGSFVTGWIAGAVLGWVYNRVAGRG